MGKLAHNIAHTALQVGRHPMVLHGYVRFRERIYDMARINHDVTRRQALGLGVISSAVLGLAACGGSPATAPNTEEGSTAVDTSATDINAAAFDALLAEGAVADDATISSSTWAQKIKDAGKLRVGGTRTSQLFSLLNEVDNKIRGLDAGLYQLLARYITGDEANYDLTQVTSDTRESVLTNDQVDAVFATYSITDDRKKVISFAGPYFVSQYGILVAANNTDINSVDDLAGKNVATQSGSTGPGLVEQYAPDAVVQEFTDDAQCRTALEQGRVDAYAVNIDLLMGSIIANPGKYRLLEETFGPEDPYGIGLPKDSDGVAFVNTWLKKIEDEGMWAKLWQVCIGDRIGQDTAPEPPAIEA